MTAHLLLVTLGPVQDFIAQARRTRDLWYGSHLLSELGRAAARALLDGGAELVFPSLKRGDAELAPCLAPLRPTGTPPRNVANKLLAEVPAGVDPRELARRTRQSVTDFWRNEVAAPVKANCAGLLAKNVDTVWDEQIDTFVELTASWLPLGDYVQTRRKLEQAVAGRKLLRDFSPWRQGRGNVPKSSLDGGRETVLSPPQERDRRLVGTYRIADGEQLDAIGLVKRAGGNPDQFVPVINVALASWVEAASRLAPSELEALRQACHEHRVARVTRTDLPCARPFPFDASVLLASRWRAVFEEQGLEGDAEAWGRTHVGPLFEKIAEPYPYVACLVADGDHMGRAIDWLGSAAEHRAFSEALARFAGNARDVVEQRHRGVLVYAGGDDILAFVPLPEALSCADELRKGFTEVMAAACRSLAAQERPTLSIGLGIGHVMESMGELLALGRQAEREAKRDRNALAVIVDKRSGGSRSWRARWDDDPIGALREAIGLLEGRLPSRKVFEIERILARLPEPGERDAEGWARVLALEVRRSLARVEGGSLRPEDAGLALDPNADYAALHAHVRAWVGRMLVARTFAQATPRERRREEETAT
ncbi:MAG: type III-B CRISPR-associated protein Cas10/Cmr2 [Myxococcota bacterium]|nr:type III-B CRISPR-associated protein Cas10/Cmr2 [Myxococcota bacterium]MDW8363845.1 type III-B CRISPR-associated protein Cas10/Cmr2 [Myxococcales bacterium]